MFRTKWHSRVHPLLCCIVTSLSCCITGESSGQAIELTLSGADGTPAQFGTAIGNAIDDPFAYDPNLPYFSPFSIPGGSLPATGFGGGDSYAAGSASEDRFFQADVDLAGNALDFIDIWGRTDAAPGEDGRHQNLTLSFFSGAGGTGALLGTSGVFNPSGQTPGVVGSAYGRFDVSSILSESQRTQVGSFRIDQPAAPAPDQIILLQEVRAGSGVPISPVPLAFVDRDTGEISIQNGTTASTVSAYTIGSAAGSLNPDNWDSIANGTVNGSLDTDSWIELSTSIADGTDISEAELPGGDGGFVFAASSTFSLGPIWSRNPAEDVAILLINDDGSTTSPAVVFTGNGGSSFPVGDLDFDNDVDLDDWALFRTGLGGVLPTLTGGETYVQGDLDADQDIDIDDFLAFRDAFEAANPGLSFASAVAAQVPEPTSGLLLVSLGMLMVGSRSRLRTKVSRHSVSCLALVALLGSVLCTTEKASAQAFTIIPAPADPANDVTESLAFNADLEAQFLFDSNVTEADINTLDLNLVDGEFATLGQGPVSVFIDNNNTITTNWIAYAQRSAALDSVGRINVWFSDTDFNGVLPTTEPDAFADIEDRSNLSRFNSFQLSNTVTGQFAALEFVRAPEGTINIGGRELRFLQGPDQFVLEVNTVTGALSINNQGGLAQSLDITAYEIASAGGSLTTNGFTGLAGLAGFPAASSSNAGDGWEVGGGSGDELLAEAFLFGDSAVGTTADLALGTGYDTTVDAQDLTFSYNLANGLQLTGSVVYVVPPGVTGDYNNDGTVDAADYTLWRDNFGEDSSVLSNNDIPGVIGEAHYTQWLNGFGDTALASASSVAIPEPAAGSMTLLGLTLIAVRRGRRRSLRSTDTHANQGEEELTTKKVCSANVARFALLMLIAMPLATATASTPDRIYLLGDDSNEAPAGAINELGAANIGQPIGSQTGTTFDGFSLDHSGNLANLNSFSDLTPIGDPTYVDVGDSGLQRPGTTGVSVGADFDGNDYLLTAGFGNPSNGDDLYEDTISYAGLINHYVQGWARPTSAGTPGGRQTVVRDTDQFRIHIDTDQAGVARWGHFYANTSQFTDTPVTLNEWTHVAQFTDGDRGIFYVNGVVAGVVGGFFSPNGFGPEGGNLGAQSFSIGADVTGDSQTPSNFFNGQIDDIDIRVSGDNSDQPAGADYGDFVLTEDNDFIAQLVASGELVPGDVNGDLVVNGDGTGDPSVDDVAFFVEHYLEQQVINFEVVGDLNSRRLMADLNFSGTTNLFDWIILVENHQDTALAASLDLGALLAASAIPEPTAGACLLSILAVLSANRRVLA